jgi:hypothetical protein
MDLSWYTVIFLLNPFALRDRKPRGMSEPIESEQGREPGQAPRAVGLAKHGRFSGGAAWAWPKALAETITQFS